MKIKLSRKQIESASDSALIAVDPKLLEASIIERQSDGGIDNPSLNGFEDFFPITMLTKEKLETLPGGDWTTIPYFKQQSPDYCESYNSYEVEIVD